MTEIKDWFSSDYHWAHRNILAYDKRPFTEIEKHDIHIVQEHNKLVKAGDNFYFIGDLAFIKKKEQLAWIENLLMQMNGNLFFIKGNHDHKDTIKLYEKYGTYLGEKKTLTIGEDRVTLNHFPQRSWDKSHHGAFHLYGHHHGDLEHTFWGRSMDVAVCIWDYKPIEWQFIKQTLEAREPLILQGDHHNPRTQ